MFYRYDVIYVLGDRKIKYHPLCSLYKEWRVSFLPECVLHTAPFSILSPSLLTIVAQSLKRNIGKSACVTKSATAIQSNLVKKINNQFGCLDDKPLPVCIQIMWLKLCRNDFRRVSDRLNRCIESTTACFKSPHKETTVNGYIDSTPGAWPNVLPKSLSRNCKVLASPNMCRCQMRSCMGNCAISR